MRARNLKPGFFSNDLLGKCQPLARILFEGLWAMADREGRLADRPLKIKAQVLPFDGCDVDELLNELANKCDDDDNPAFITRYQGSDRHRYIQVLHFKGHQNPHVNEAKSTIPAPEEHSTSTVQVPDISDASTIPAPEEHTTNPAESLILDPESLLLDPDQRSSSHPADATPIELEEPSEDEEAEGKGDKKLFSEGSIEYGLAFLLRSQILKNLPDARVPKATPEGLAGWCSHVDKMIRLDKRGHPEIRAIITWCQQDSFWRANILSPKKLREKWETLVMQSKREEAQPHGISGSPSSQHSGQAATDDGIDWTKFNARPKMPALQ